MTDRGPLDKSGRVKDELNQTQAAEYLGISRPALLDLLRAGAIPHYRPTPRKYVIRRADLEVYKRSVTVGTPAAEGCG
jgi:excisionase family DNA binding protein